MTMRKTMNPRAESPAQQAAGPRCAAESAWRKRLNERLTQG